MPPFFILFTHTHTYTYKNTCSPACLPPPDDWLFVCVEEFTLHCVQGNWLPVVLTGLSSPSLASLQRFVWYWWWRWWCLWGGGLEAVGYIYRSTQSLSFEQQWSDPGLFGRWRDERGQVPHVVSGSSQYMAAVGSRLSHIG